MNIYKRVDDLVNEYTEKMKMPEVFMSPEYLAFIRQKAANIISGTFYHLRQEGFAATQSAEDRILHNLSVNLMHDPQSEITAFAADNGGQGQLIGINTGHELVMSHPAREEQHLAVLGMLYHELGHVLYTDYPTKRSWLRKLESKGWFPQAPGGINTPGGVIVEQLLQDEDLRPLVIDLASGIENRIEDGYIETEVRLMCPGMGRALPEGDEDVKVYNLGDVIAEAERRSANWKVSKPGDDAGFIERRAEPSAPVYGTERVFEPDGEAAYVPEPEPEYSPEPEYITEPEPEQYRPDAFENIRTGGYGPEDEDADYAAEGSEDGEPPRARRRFRRERAENQAGPVLGTLAILGYKLRRAMTAGEAAAVEDEVETGPEMPADRAAKYYAASVTSLKLRFRLALFLSVILCWISFGLPTAGALGHDLKTTSLVCLAIELTVVMLGLDIFTNGIMSLVRNRPGLWTMVSFSCIASALDAVVSYAVGTAGWGLPFCGAAALSMTFALWGALLTARGLRLSAKAQELAEDPFCVSAETGVLDEGAALIKFKRPTTGWLRRSEEPDAAENAFSSLAPWLIAASLLLSIIATAVSKSWTSFFRILAAISSCTAPAAAFMACALPYAVLARRVFRSGAAVAGWPGIRDIGRSRRLVVTDTDLFPSDAVSIESIRILDGMAPVRVISAAGSLICASGSGLAQSFLELMRKNGCTMLRVEDFCCHEGGGLTSIIEGQEVICGSAGFMRLMGIMIPQKLASRSSVFIAMGGTLTGIFNINYEPTGPVRAALASLLHSNRNPLFAVRDFLVTPLMLRQKYRLPTDGFDFPPFARRYEVSGAEPGEDSQISALLSREGLGSFVEVADCGRKAYIASALGTVLGALCAVVGVALFFILIVTGGAGAVTAANVMTYLLLWFVPVLIASIASAV